MIRITNLNMSKLSDTTASVRKYLIYFGIFVVVVILLQTIYRFITKQAEPINPLATPYAFVDEAFGPIEYPQISSLEIAQGSNPTFSINGQFNASPTSVNIYKTNRPRETLASVRTGEQLATNLGITRDYTTDGETLNWSTNDKRSLKYDKLTKKVDYVNQGINLATIRAQRPSIFDTENFSNESARLLGEVSLQNFFSDYESTQTFLTADGDNYQNTTSANNADYIKEDYFPQLEAVSLKSAQTIENDKTLADTTATPILGKMYTQDPKTGISSLILTNSETLDTSDQAAKTQIREFHEIGYDLSEEKGIYSLKTSEQAWEDVKDGKGFLKYLALQDGSNSNASQIQVTRFVVDPTTSEIGFLLPDNWTEYIYPIYVFKGQAETSSGAKADFIFYAKAID